MEPLWEFCVVITFLCSLGFPGNLETLIPQALSMLILYGPFMLQIVLMVFASGGTVLDIRLLDLKKRYIPVYIMLAVWFGVSMISTRFPTEQIISCVRFSTTALFCLWIVEKYDICHILELTYYAGMIFLFFTVVCMVLLPGMSYTMENGERSFSGLFSTKNPCAAEFSFMLMVHALLFRECRKTKRSLPKFFFISVPVHLFFLMLCKGMGALFCAAVPIVYLSVFDGKGMFKHRLQLGTMHAAVSFGFMILAMSVLPLLKPFFDAIGKDVTLTGRTPMWEQLINVMTTHNSFTGFGFTMFWKDPQATKLFHQGFSRGSWGNTMTFGAHNTLLEMWLDVGLLGIAAYHWMLIAVMRRPNEMTQSQYDFCAAYMLWQTIAGLTERSYIPLYFQTMYLFLCVGESCNRPERKKSQASWRSSLKYSEGQILPDDMKGG